ncbi:MAG: hypothetical protein AVDCRST_MAG38-341, partial [uncultured Solirubrobacteraceae bacterium]
RSRSRSRRPAIHDARVTAPAAAVALLAGAIMAVGDEPARPAGPLPQALEISSGAVRIAYPSTWQPLSDAESPAGLSLQAPLGLAPRPGVEAQPHSRLFAGMVPESGPSLLPLDLERRIERTGNRETVRLGTHEAYRYRDVTLSGQDVASTLYTVPTSGGVAMIACSAPRFVDTLEGQCEAMATTLRLSGVESLPLGPNAAYGRLVSGVLVRLDDARRHGRQWLRLAKRAPGQARRAADLETAFRGAAARLASSGSRAGTGEIHRALVESLRGIRNGYGELATAAAAGDRRRYDAARRIVSAREARLSRVLERMRRLGYRLR